MFEFGKASHHPWGWVGLRLNANKWQLVGQQIRRYTFDDLCPDEAVRIDEKPCWDYDDWERVYQKGAGVDMLIETGRKEILP